jgi:hypothetical protein
MVSCKMISEEGDEGTIDGPCLFGGRSEWSEQGEGEDDEWRGEGIGE